MQTNILPVLTTASYNANNQQTAFGTTGLTYDANGNLTGAGSGASATTYTWNARNQLTGIASSGFAASFQYDALGRRTGKTVQGVTTTFVYDGVNPVQEKNGSTVTANLLTGLGIDEFFTRTDAAGAKSLLHDGLGSTIALDDGTGTLQPQYTYEPFGYATAAGTANSNSYKYTGREDDGTGLYYYRARYYHPRLQRFVSEDPLRLLAGPNVYVYVSNNPLNFRDPEGLFIFPWHFYITYRAMRQNGAGIGDSLSMAWQSTLADGNQSSAAANEHGLAQPGQTPQKAAEMIQTYIDLQLALGTERSTANALHDVQDLSPRDHGPDKVWDGLQGKDFLTRDFWEHVYHDTYPSDAEVEEAIQNSINLLKKAPYLNKRK